MSGNANALKKSKALQEDGEWSEEASLRSHLCIDLNEVRKQAVVEESSRQKEQRSLDENALCVLKKTKTAIVARTK